MYSAVLHRYGMNDVNPLVFINYRAGDQALAALLLDTELSHRYGSDQVFLDSRSLIAGQVFDTRLLVAVRSCGVLLSVIGKSWLTTTDEHGRRLIDRRHDWVRLEIAEAFAAGVPVVPVLIDDVPRLTAASLPPKIRELAKYQFVRLRPQSFRPDFDNLVAQLDMLNLRQASTEKRHQT
jgi:hypothetical protein